MNCNRTSSCVLSVCDNLNLKVTLKSVVFEAMEILNLNGQRKVRVSIIIDSSNCLRDDEFLYPIQVDEYQFNCVISLLKLP